MNDVEESRRVTNFKPIRLDFGPFAGISRVVEDSSENGVNVKILEDFLNSVEFLNILKYYLKTKDFEYDFGSVIDKYIDFNRNYFIIDKQIINQYINNPSSINELDLKNKIELLKQKDHFNFGEDVDYDTLGEFDIFDYITMDELKILLMYQKKYTNVVPTIDELNNAGIIDFIINQVKDLGYINQEKIINLINDSISDRLMGTKYLTFEQIEYYYKYPQKIIEINNYEDFINRNKIIAEYDNLTDDDIKNILDLEKQKILLSKNCLTPNDILTVIDEHSSTTIDGRCIEEEITDDIIQKWIYQETIKQKG